LDADLRRRIDDVFGDHASSVWTRIREVQALLEGLGEATAREASSSMTLIAGVEGRSKAAIIQESSVRASETSAQATINNGLQVSIDNILLDLDDPATGLSAVGTALSTLSGRVDVTEDDIIVSVGRSDSRRGTNRSPRYRSPCLGDRDHQPLVRGRNYWREGR
jgi:hypothetical protein